MKRRRDLLAAFFLLPLFLYLLVFVLAPTFDTLAISLQHRENFGPIQFAGLANYVRLTHNPLLPSIAAFTFLQLASAVAISQALALSLALGAAGLWRRLARNPRAALLLAIGGVAAVFLYPGFSPDFSANRFRVFLIDFPLLAWLPMEERWRIAGSMAHWVDTLGAVREFAGFTFCVYLCGTLALPREVLDAARVDGGPAWRRLGSVTLPLLAPTILVATALDLFRVVQVLDRPQITLSGSLGESGSTGLIYLIQVSFREGLFGYAAALLVASHVVAALAAALLGNSGVRWLRGAGWLGRANRMP